MRDVASPYQVAIVIDWPGSSALDREWATELAVASLGWGSRFGADFAPVFLVPDPSDESLPSGVAMYAVTMRDGAQVVSEVPLVILLGEPTTATRAFVADALEHRIPCLVRAGSVWCTDAALARVRITAPSVGAMIDAIHDGVSLPDVGPTAAVASSADVRVVHEPPQVAIVIPTFNRADYLSAAIDSALGQDYPHTSIVIADDGSTDHTAAVAQSRAGSRVRYFTTPHTNGPDTRNAVLGTVDAPFILWLGDDDLLTPDCVSSRVRALAACPTADVLYGNLITVNAALEPTGNDIITEDWFGRDAALIATLFDHNPITEGGALVRHDAIRSVHGYDAAFPKAHDYEFWTRLAPRAVFKRDPATTYIWRWHGGNMGLGSGTNPYHDAHVRIVLGMLTRHAPQELFPQVPWHNLSATAAEGVAALLTAVRLWREHAIDFALPFAERAVECWPSPDSHKVLEQLRTRQRARADAHSSLVPA